MDSKIVWLIIVILIVIIFFIRYRFIHKENQFKTFDLPLGKVPLEKPFQNKLLLSSSPEMYYLPQFLNENEIKHVLDLIQTRFQRSRAEPANGEPMEHEDRTSYSAFLSKSETSVIENIEKRASEISGMPLANLEDIQIVRYTPGQFFNPHYDYFVRYTEKNGQDGKATIESLKRGGQRVKSIFVYLNLLDENEKGGSTIFPVLKRKFKPVYAGDALMWNNMENGVEDERTLHGGEKVQHSIKYGMNIWIREKAFQ